MLSPVLLKSKINYEYFAEVNKPLDPIQYIHNNSKTLKEIMTKLEQLSVSLNTQYPGHTDFYYVFNHTQPSNGCYEAWFNLYGVRK